MLTFVFAEHCGRAGAVKIPQPEGRDRESFDYLGLTLGEATSWAALPATAANSFKRRAGRAVLKYHGRLKEDSR